MTIGIPQTTLLVIYLFATAFAVANHGKCKKKENFYGRGLMFLLELSILKFGGFFAELGFPQCIYGFLAGFGLLSAVSNHGKVPKELHSGPATCLALFIMIGIYYAGGFFG